MTCEAHSDKPLVWRTVGCHVGYIIYWITSRRSFFAEETDGRMTKLWITLEMA